MFSYFKENFIVQQWLAGIGVSMLIVQLGFMGGWPSPTLARLTAPDSPIPLNPEQASWVASLVNLGRFIGAVIGSVVTSYIGSRRGIIVTLIPIAIGWFVVAFANSVEWLYVSRISSGLGLGMAFSTFPLYLGEVSMTEIRGALVSLATCGSPVGQLIASIAGAYLSLTIPSSIYFVLAVMLCGWFYWLPESPHYLLKQGDREAARKSINWYRNGREVDAELVAVEKFVSSDITMSFTDRLKEFKNPAVRKAVYQVIAVFTFMQACGLNNIQFYMEIILIQAKVTVIDPAKIVIYVNLCGLFASAISIFLIDRCGRRFLLLVSSVGITISMVSMMAYFMLMDKSIDVSNLQWLPIAAMFIYMITFFVGLMPVPSTVLSEICPANVKCITACIGSLTAGIMSFVSTKTYQPLIDLIGETYVFLIFAIITAMAIPYALFIMPETKGKSLQQIQDELINK